MSKSRTIIWTVVITLGVVALAAGAGTWAWRKWHPAKKPLNVEVKRVSRGKLVELVQAPGEVTPKKKVSISARVSARITELPVEKGAKVTRGDPNANPPVPASVLVRLDDKDLKSRLRSTVANREAQRAETEVLKTRIASESAAIAGTSSALAQAEKDLERKSALLKTGDIGQALFDEVDAKARGLRAQLEAARLALEATKQNLIVLQHRLDAAEALIEEAQEALTYTTISTPIDGVVTRLNAEVGEMVMTGTMNNPGTVIMEVADLSRMLVIAQVDEADMGHLAVGQKAVIHIQAYGERAFTGAVDTIPLTSAKSPTGTNIYRVEILLDPTEERLYTGLTADIEIRTREHENVILVPSQAVLGRKVEELPKDIREGSPCVDRKKTFALVVYRILNGKAVVTPVSLGPADLTQTIVSDGLTENDTVIVGPYKILDTLKHDAEVTEEKDTQEKGRPVK